MISFQPDDPTADLSTIDMSEDLTKDVKLTYCDIDASYDSTADASWMLVLSMLAVTMERTFLLHLDVVVILGRLFFYSLTSSNNILTDADSTTSTYPKSFTYMVRVDGDWSNEQTVDVKIQEVSDNPIAFSFDVDATESHTDATPSLFL